MNSLISGCGPAGLLATIGSEETQEFAGDGGGFAYGEEVARVEQDYFGVGDKAGGAGGEARGDGGVAGSVEDESGDGQFGERVGHGGEHVGWISPAEERH